MGLASPPSYGFIFQIGHVDFYVFLLNSQVEPHCSHQELNFSLTIASPETSSPRCGMSILEVMNNTMAKKSTAI